MHKRRLTHFGQPQGLPLQVACNSLCEIDRAPQIGGLGGLAFEGCPFAASRAGTRPSVPTKYLLVYPLDMQPGDLYNVIARTYAEMTALTHTFN